MSRSLASLTLLVVAFASTSAQAGWLCGDGGCKPAHSGCQVKWVCCPKWEKEKIEKSCFDIECEQICVPKVRLPWQDCCKPRCAKIISVHRLKKHTYECGEKCVLTWEAKAVCTRCCKPGYSSYGPARGCNPTPCAAPGEYHAPQSLQPLPAGEVPAAPAP